MKKWLKAAVAPLAIAAGLGVFSTTALAVTNYSFTGIPWSADNGTNCNGNPNSCYQLYFTTTPSAYAFVAGAPGSGGYEAYIQEQSTSGSPYRFALYDATTASIIGPWRFNDTSCPGGACPQHGISTTAWAGHVLYPMVSNDSSVNQGGHDYFGHVDGV